jgi:superfamily II DNA/RNA helicase
VRACLCALILLVVLQQEGRQELHRIGRTARRAARGTQAPGLEGDEEAVRRDGVARVGRRGKERGSRSQPAAHRSLTRAESPCSSTGTTVESRYVRIGAVCRFILFCMPIACFSADAACVEAQRRNVSAPRGTARTGALAAATKAHSGRGRRERTASASSAPAPASGASRFLGSSVGGGTSASISVGAWACRRSAGTHRRVARRARQGAPAPSVGSRVLCPPTSPARAHRALSHASDSFD